MIRGGPNEAARYELGPWRAPAAVAVLLLGATGCVTDDVRPRSGLASFRVELTTSIRGRERQAVRARRMRARRVSRLSWSSARARRARARDGSEPGRKRRRAATPSTWEGSALIDVRSGRLVGAPPMGMALSFVDGVGEADLRMPRALGDLHLDRGLRVGTAPGTLATGVSSPICSRRRASIRSASRPITGRARSCRQRRTSRAHRRPALRRRCDARRSSVAGLFPRTPGQRAAPAGSDYLSLALRRRRARRDRDRRRL